MILSASMTPRQEAEALIAVVVPRLRDPSSVVGVVVAKR
jgi:hypothetical protein